MSYDTENPYGEITTPAYGRATTSILRRAGRRRAEATRKGLGMLAGVGGTSDQMLNLLKESQQAGMESDADTMAGMGLEHARAIEGAREAQRQFDREAQLQRDLMDKSQAFQEKILEKGWGREDELTEKARQEKRRQKWWQLGLGALGALGGTLIAPGPGTMAGWGLGSGVGSVIGG